MSATPAAAAKAGRHKAPGSSLWVRLAALVLIAWSLAMLARQLRLPGPLWPLPSRAGDSWARIESSIGLSQLERLGFAVKVYYLAFGSTPESLETLLERGLVQPSDLIDPWGRKFHYLPMEGGYLLAAYERGGSGLDPYVRLLESLPGAGEPRHRSAGTRDPGASESETILLQ